MKFRHAMLAATILALPALLPGAANAAEPIKGLYVSGALGGKLVRVHLGLQDLPLRVQCGLILGKLRRQAKQRKVVSLQVHKKTIRPGRIRRSRTCRAR